MHREEVQTLINSADIIHFHNRWQRQEVFKTLGIVLPKGKKAVIQMHSPRHSEDFKEEVASKIPIAVVAQYQPRQWPELTYIVPNVVDINDEKYMPMQDKPVRAVPVVSFAPSNTNMTGWDNKGYNLVMPVLKRLKIDGKLILQLVVDKPHDIAMQLKRGADIGIDEIATGSYHLSSLEYLAMGVPCFANIDHLTGKVLKDLTGCSDLPWVLANRDTFALLLQKYLDADIRKKESERARKWMEQYWNPEFLVKQYEDMYDDLG